MTSVFCRTLPTRLRNGGFCVSRRHLHKYPNCGDTPFSINFYIYIYNDVFVIKIVYACVRVVAPGAVRPGAIFDNYFL